MVLDGVTAGTITGFAVQPDTNQLAVGTAAGDVHLLQFDCRLLPQVLSQERGREQVCAVIEGTLLMGVSNVVAVASLAIPYSVYLNRKPLWHLICHTIL